MWLRPQLKIVVEDLGSDGCRLHLHMVFNRTSALFQVSGVIDRRGPGY